MRLARIASDGREGIALADGDSARALFDTDAGYPGGLPELVSAGSQALQRGAEVLATAEPVDLESVSYLPLLGQTGKTSTTPGPSGHFSSQPTRFRPAAPGCN